MNSQSIRRSFLDFFKKKGHQVVPSSSVVPSDDPSLLFVNAGMNQFKDLFLGKTISDYTKATTAQKCIRVGGKHNDLENVGHTSRHLTFFEMLGNFSFGDYFKEQAIAYAWELTLTVFEFEEKSIWATVFYEDEESFELWKRFLPEERIVRMGEKDNFWAMGDTGPCGPCSELYFDRGATYSKARSPAEDIEGVRFLEFWNLVFMEFNRNVNGELQRLPKQSVDTGAGLERILSLKMTTESLFETDILRSLIAKVEHISNKTYDPTHANHAAFRVIADHIRSLSFAIADGVQPSNIERGYVLRKVLRRAMRYGRQLDLNRPFLGEIAPTLVSLMGEDFPELKLAQHRIIEILTLEEENFLRTLKRGGGLLNQVIIEAHQRGEITGEEAFKLKDTYGLPLEEIILLAKDVNLQIDIKRFEELEHEAKERSRGTRKTTDQSVLPTIYGTHFDHYGPTEFVGYHQLGAQGIVLGLIKEGKEVSSLVEGEEGVILLDKSPFYAEKGGQVGDQGTISSSSGLFEVIDSQTPFTDVIAHKGWVKEGTISVADSIHAKVDEERRLKIGSNHTATHLLHWALRLVLGEHVKQAGSIVESKKLRFDFSHHKGLTEQELIHIESLVNKKIRENRIIHIYELPFIEVQNRADIIQFFGEKYGSKVRVVDIDFSKELCGGTHLHATGSIGYFHIIKEGSIAAGIRRIEAVTGEEAELAIATEKQTMTQTIAQLSQTAKAQTSEMALLRKSLLKFEVEKILTEKIKIAETPFLSYVCALQVEEMKECADQIMNRAQSLVLLLISKQEERCHILIRVSADQITKGIYAADLLKEITPILEARGGGKQDSAQGGGQNPSQIPQAINHAKKWLEAKHS